MPRKKKTVEERIISFLLNPEDKAVIDEMVEYCIDKDITEKRKINAIAGKPYFVNRDKMVSRLKFIYYYICDYICENAYLYEDSAFVNINQEKMKKYLKEDISPVLKNLISMNILKCDGSMEVGKKSYGYQLVKNEFQSYRIQLPVFKEKMAAINELKAGKIIKDGLNDYFKVLQKIKIEEDKIDEIKETALTNKYLEEAIRKEFDYFMRILNIRFLISYHSIKLHESSYKISNLSCSTNNFHNNTFSFYNAETVPEDTAIEKAGKIIDAETVPNTIFIDAETVPAIVAETVPEKYLPRYIVNQHSNVARRDMRNETIPWLSEFKVKPEQKELESDDTTLARIEKAVARVNGNELNISRPNGKSRVYTTITNLNREFRDYLTLDGSNLIGADLKNSQPLIASVVFKTYWKSNGSSLPTDVLEYQKVCETGRFYEYFMEKNKIPEELRRQFKVEFFKRVFFSMHTGKPNILKQQFIEKYPNCWLAVCDIKGGYFCKDYGEFAILLQETEAEIFYDNVNVKLLQMGINAFNIYDSIYVNNEEDYETVNKLIVGFFNDLGISPKLQPEYYGTHKLKQHEMKKNYTVDELLKPKEAVMTLAPTKLQHLKIGEASAKMDDINRIVKGIQEQDAEDEKATPSMSNKEIAIELLKAKGLKINKENVDYLANLVNVEFDKRDAAKNEPERPAYKYVNPYVKKST